MRASVGIGVVCGVLAAYFAIDSARLRRELSRAAAQRDAIARREADLSRRVEEASARAGQIARELAQLQAEKDELVRDLTRSQAAAGRVVSLDLAAAPPPRGSLPSVDAGSGIEVVRLLVAAREGWRTPLRATIRRPDGTAVWSGTGSPGGPASRKISLLVPARFLAPGDYVLSLVVAGADPADAGGDYAFRVRR